MTIDVPEAPRLRRRRRSSAGRIGEIDGLRGISLTLVVVFHLFGHGRVSGGVDVFLTISGFLLVMSLGRALQRERPLGIVARWGRTFVRLAPPATLVLLTVTVMSYTVLSPWTRGQTLVEVVSTALYVENWQLIASQLSYDAAGPETSPLQHFWSLSVQAQFFLLFPLAVGVLTLIARTTRARLIIFWSLLTVATACSFAYATSANLHDPVAAYFDTRARFWELGIGGLVAGLIIIGWSLPKVIRAVAGWLGLAMIIGSGFIFDGGTSYPGPAALLPVGGAILVLLSANGGRASTSPLLNSRPLRFLDSISYELYLWHWPILIVFLTVKQRDAVGWRGAAVVLAVSLAATALTRLVLARPTAWTNRADARRTIAFAIVAIIAAAAPAAIIQSARTVSAATTTLDTCAGAAALDPERPECANVETRGAPVPALDLLVDDQPDRPDCYARWGDDEVRMCALGPRSDYDKRLLVVGDSHGHALTDAYAGVAESLGWRLDVASRAGCQWVSRAAPDRSGPSSVQEECGHWRTAINGYAASGDYDAIVTTASTNSWFEPVPDGMTRMEFHTELILDAWASRPSADVPILAIRDNPVFPESMVDCLADRDAIARGECSLPREDAIRGTGLYDAIEQTPNAHLIDLMDYECGPTRCDMVVGGIIVTRDGNHLTRTYAETLRPYLERELVAAFDGR
ncbi:MAG TPA: acyltransferase [Candidatus Microbacterium pullistercoris]|nr:acyltransferase [Candidatus Microbacterium pullistercoris]